MSRHARRLEGDDRAREFLRRSIALRHIEPRTAFVCADDCGNQSSTFGRQCHRLCFGRVSQCTRTRDEPIEGSLVHSGCAHRATPSRTPCTVDAWHSGNELNCCDRSTAFADVETCERSCRSVHSLAVLSPSVSVDGCKSMTLLPPKFARVAAEVSWLPRAWTVKSEQTGGQSCGVCVCGMGR